MDADEYLKVRLEPQISWYDDKSKSNKSRYLAGRVIEIVGAAVIPFLARYGVLPFCLAPVGKGEKL